MINNRLPLRFLKLILIFLSLIMIIATGCDAPNENDNDDNESVDLEAAREAFLEWEARITEIHTAADEVMEAYNQAVTKLSEGRVDIFSVYDYISNEVIPANNTLETAMESISPGSALSKKQQEELNSAKFDLANGLYWRTKAFERFLEFLDNQQLSLMDEIKDDFAFANDYMINGIAKYIGVKMELGLIEDEQKDQE